RNFGHEFCRLLGSQRPGRADLDVLDAYPGGKDRGPGEHRLLGPRVHRDAVPVAGECAGEHSRLQQLAVVSASAREGAARGNDRNPHWDASWGLTLPITAQAPGARYQERHTLALAP